MDFSKIKINSGKEEKTFTLADEEGSDVIKTSDDSSASGLRFNRLRKPDGDSFSNVAGADDGGVAADNSAVTSESLALELPGLEGDGDPFGGMLDDLLDDDEVGEGGDSFTVDEGDGVVWDDQLSELLGEDDDESDAFVKPLVSPSGGVEGVPSGERVLPEPQEVPIKKSVEKKKGKTRREARAGKRVRLHSKSSSYRGSKSDLDSKMAERGGLEYLVDADGVLVPAVKGKSGVAENFSKLVKAAESNAAVKYSGGEDASEVVTDGEVKGSVVYPWSTSKEVAGVREGKQRLHEGELSFYKNVGLSKSEILGEFAREVREPVSAREARVAGRVRKSVVRQGVAGHAGYANHVGSAVTLRDQELLKFLAKFKYATAKQLSNIGGVQERSCLKRLVELRGKGLVESIRLWGASPVWCLTSAGMLLSGFDLPIVQAGKISYASIAHQFVVNNTASNLVGGGVNVLHLREFPLKNRFNSKGEAVFGEEVVSETEIQSSFSKMRLLTKAEVYRPLIVSTLEREFREWEEGGRVGGSPEFMFGNEYMWMLFPPKVFQQVYHTPDFVVRRPRNADGRPESIAIEVELASKSEQKYDRVLRVFKADNRMYKKVIWVCKSMQTAKALEKVAKDIGLWQEGRIDIVPITTREGIFEGRDLWTI